MTITTTSFDWTNVDETAYPHLHVLADFRGTKLDAPSGVLEVERKFPTRMTLVLDLDETLVHATEAVLLDVDGEPLSAHANIRAGEAGEERTLSVYLRPYVRSFLMAVSQIFEVVTFTAGERSYADALLAVLDPDGNLIHHRLYREHCISRSTPFGEAMLKDLRVLVRDLPLVVFVDNSVSAFALQPQNGLVVNSFRGDPEDVELVLVAEVLTYFQDERRRNPHRFDVRTVLAKHYRLEEIVAEFARGNENFNVNKKTPSTGESVTRMSSSPAVVVSARHRVSFMSEVGNLLTSNFPSLAPIVQYFNPPSLADTFRTADRHTATTRPSSHSLVVPRAFYIPSEFRN